jgi:hypothetical protein
MPGSIYVGYGLTEAANFYIDVEGSTTADDHGWLDLDLYQAWKSAQLTYEALTDKVDQALNPTKSETRPFKNAWIK